MLKIEDITTYEVDKTTGCVHWTGKSHKSKPILYKDRGVFYVRSEVYKLRKGLIPSGFYVKMTCKNWDCINSAHMELKPKIAPR